jgi:hypothetical protein
MSREKIFIKLSNPDYYIGMSVDKQKTIHSCVSYKEHIRKTGEKTYIFTWKSTSKKTGKIFFQDVGFNSFSISALKNHPEERNKKLVELGLKLAKRNALLREKCE